MPGALALLLCWLLIRNLLRHSGTAFELAALTARPPATADVEERQLANVGLRSPAVHLVDSEVANAAAVGSSVDDAAIVVSRGLLDTLNRDETQGVLAHLVGRIGNGDLGIGRTIASLYLTLGLVAAPAACSHRPPCPQCRHRCSGAGILPHRRAPRPRVRLRRRLGAARGSGHRWRRQSESPTTTSYRSVLLLSVMGAEPAFSLHQMVLSWL